MSRVNVPGTVYLLHFASKLKHAQHYMGWTESLDVRLERHESGDGAKIVRAAASMGIYAGLVRTWQGSRKLERRLKSWKKARQLCPECRGKDPLVCGSRVKEEELGEPATLSTEEIT